MAKTNPIGVRFDEDMLSVLKTEHGIDSPQKALNFLYNYWKMNKHHVNPMPGVLRERPSEIPIMPEPEMPSYEAYKSEIKSAGSVNAIEKIISASKKDTSLANWQKEHLYKYGMEISRTLDF